MAKPPWIVAVPQPKCLLAAFVFWDQCLVRHGLERLPGSQDIEVLCSRDVKEDVPIHFNGLVLQGIHVLRKRP